MELRGVRNRRRVATIVIGIGAISVMGISIVFIGFVVGVFEGVIHGGMLAGAGHWDYSLVIG